MAAEVDESRLRQQQLIYRSLGALRLVEGSWRGDIAFHSRSFNPHLTASRASEESQQSIQDGIVHHNSSFYLDLHDRDEHPCTCSQYCCAHWFERKFATANSSERKDSQSPAELDVELRKQRFRQSALAQRHDTQTSKPQSSYEAATDVSQGCWHWKPKEERACDI